MRLDAGWDEDFGILAETLAGFCKEHCPDDEVRQGAGALSRELWKSLASLGIFTAAVPGDESGPAELVAAMEALGYAAFPGPVFETVFGAGVLEGEELERVLVGESIVSLAMGPWIAWGPEADVFIDCEVTASGAVSAWRSSPLGVLEAVQTLGGEPWARGALERGEKLSGAERAAATADLARAAYLAAAGRRLLDAASEHARTRKQFGKAIGEFQAVAHPLANVYMRWVGARGLVRRAALMLVDDGLSEDTRGAIAMARLSAEAASLEAVQTGHQVFGAIGITLEGPAFHVSRRIRHRVSASFGASAAREIAVQTLGLEGGEG